MVFQGKHMICLLKVCKNASMKSTSSSDFLFTIIYFSISFMLLVYFWFSILCGYFWKLLFQKRTSIINISKLIGTFYMYILHVFFKYLFHFLLYSLLFTIFYLIFLSYFLIRYSIEGFFPSFIESRLTHIPV